MINRPQTLPSEVLSPEGEMNADLATAAPRGEAPALETSEAESPEAIAWEMARAADNRKGANIVLLEVGQVSYLADYFAIATGQSRAQVRAIADEILERVEERFGRLPRNVSGQSDASWVLLDYGDVVAHVMLPEEREFYDLEAFWGHASRIDYVPELA
jgi:ribosome-associated protein